MSLSRRDVLKQVAGAAIVAGTSRVVLADDRTSAVDELRIDPTPRHEISPYLYMQFMEPLGVTDSSVEAAWDHLRDDWREDVIETTAALKPTMMRWGGIYTDFYRWREGVGPRDKRPPMHNLMWGGIESNQVGTGEFVDFCRRVGNAEPLMCVNFESDGRQRYMQAKGSIRTADASEAADWVSYCNDRQHRDREQHGHAEPHAIRYWQIGNETSYDRQGFDLETAARKTVEFAEAMRRRDGDIQIIAWGDSGWAGRMWEVAGEHVDMLAFHQMFNPDDERDPVLSGEHYRRDPAQTWDCLMRAWEKNDRKIREVRESCGSNTIDLAMTECHFAIPGRDRCDVMSTWATGVSYGRILNNHLRHSDVLRIATAADFCGTRWQVNAVMIPVPRAQGKAYLMPVARVMQLFRAHVGSHLATVESAPDDLDVVATRRGDKLIVNIVNTSRDRTRTIQASVGDIKLGAATMYQIVDEPMVEVSQLNSDRVMQTKQTQLTTGGRWEFPAASVSVVEVDLQVG